MTAKNTNRKTRRRVRLSAETKTEVLQRCKRHCCLCFGLRNIKEVVQGQIVHLDRDPSNSDLDNLAYLCLECHKNYDTRSNRVLAYTPEEIRYYREQLYRALGHNHIEWTIELRCDASRYKEVKKAVDEACSALRKCIADVTVHESPVE